MDGAHLEFIKLAIAYTLLGAFIFTVAVTCLSLIGIVRFADTKQQKRLFTALIVQLVVVGVGFFTQLLTFDPKDAASAALQTAQRESGRVYIQVAGERSREIGDQVRDVASKIGFVTPGIETVSAASVPENNEIRYFFPEQAANAKRLAKSLSNQKVGNFDLKYLPGFQGRAPNDVLEVWLAKLKKVGLGEPCKAMKDCLSLSCYPGPGDSGNFCNESRTNCAFPRARGFMYRTVKEYEGKDYQCYRPSTGKARWKIVY